MSTLEFKLVTLDLDPMFAVASNGCGDLVAYDPEGNEIGRVNMGDDPEDRAAHRRAFIQLAGQVYKHLESPV